MRLLHLVVASGLVLSTASGQTPLPPGSYVRTSPFPTEAPLARGTIRYSAHDFSHAAWNRNSGGAGQEVAPGQVCATCHIPHVEGRDATGDGRTALPLLWSRKPSTATYTMYASPTLQGATDAQPTGSSRLCLSCHDGSVALDLYHRRTTSQSSVFVAAALRVPGQPAGGPGIDFRADHPISITYDAGTGQNQDPYLRPVNSPFPGTVPGQRIVDVLEGNRVQCASCHDVHNTRVPDDAPHLLRVRNNRPDGPSGLCAACHLK